MDGPGIKIQSSISKNKIEVRGISWYVEIKNKVGP